MADDYIKTGTSSAIKLEEWKGAYSIASGWINKEGEFQLNWCEVERFDKAAGGKVKKKLPVKIGLGNKERLQEILIELLDQTGYEWANSSTGPAQDNDEIPF